MYRKAIVAALAPLCAVACYLAIPTTQAGFQDGQEGKVTITFVVPDEPASTPLSLRTKASPETPAPIKEKADDEEKPAPTKSSPPTTTTKTPKASPTPTESEEVIEPSPALEQDRKPESPATTTTSEEDSDENDS